MLRRLAFTLLLAAVAWLAYGFGGEALEAVADLATPPDQSSLWRWRLGDPGPTALARFLATVGGAARPGSVIVLATATGSADQDFFLRQWAAYQLPRHRIILLSHPSAPHVADYLAAYGTAVEDPRLEELSRQPGGVLYRVRPWPGSP